MRPSLYSSIPTLLRHSVLNCCFQGTPSAEIQAIAAARSHARGSTAYLNMETGDSHGDSASLSALIGAGVSRVVIGMRHPLAHSRGLAIKELRQHGVQVDVLGEAACFEDAAWEDSTIHKCLAVNEVCLQQIHCQAWTMIRLGLSLVQSGHAF